MIIIYRHGRFIMAEEHQHVRPASLNSQLQWPEGDGVLEWGGRHGPTRSFCRFDGAGYIFSIAIERADTVPEEPEELFFSPGQPARGAIG